MTVYQHVLCCTAVLVLCNLQGGAEAKRRRTGSDLLMGAMQDSISLLTELTTDQADKIASLTEDQADKIASLTKDQADKIASLTTLMTTKLDEAREEIGQLKRDLSSSQSKMVQFKNESKVGIEELKRDLSSSQSKIDEAKEEIEQLKRDRSSSQSKIAQLENGTASFYNETMVAMDELKNELKSELAENSEEKRAELVNATSSMKNESEAGMEELKSELSNDIEDLAAKLDDISWPEGSYCILGSGGSCPAGFTRKIGRILGIYTPASRSGYTAAATFGDSYVSCRNGCSYSGTDHNGDLTLTSCCK